MYICRRTSHFQFRSLLTVSKRKRKQRQEETKVIVPPRVSQLNEEQTRVVKTTVKQVQTMAKVRINLLIVFDAFI